MRQRRRPNKGGLAVSALGPVCLGVSLGNDLPMDNQDGIALIPRSYGTRPHLFRHRLTMGTVASRVRRRRPDGAAGPKARRLATCSDKWGRPERGACGPARPPLGRMLERLIRQEKLYHPGRIVARLMAELKLAQEAELLDAFIQVAEVTDEERLTIGCRFWLEELAAGWGRAARELLNEVFMTILRAEEAAEAGPGRQSALNK